MTQAPVVTVVVPALDAAGWIADALQSVINQSYPKDALEVIVVDDGSRDDTSRVARRVMARSGIAHTVVSTPSTAGPSAARNLGWTRARGEWIQFLDADDVIEPKKIELQVQSAHMTAPDVAVVFSKWGRLACREGSWIREGSDVDPTVGDDPVLDILRSDNFIATGSQIFRRAWLERVDGYVDAYRWIEDVDLLLRLAFRGGRFLKAPAVQPVFWYRQRSGSLARSDNGAFVDGCLRNARLAEAHWREVGGLTAPRIQLLTDLYCWCAPHYAERDPTVFEALVRWLHSVDPAFAPRHRGALRLLARLVGYAQAELLAVRYRRLKRLVRP